MENYVVQERFQKDSTTNLDFTKVRSMRPPRMVRRSITDNGKQRTPTTQRSTSHHKPTANNVNDKANDNGTTTTEES